MHACRIAAFGCYCFTTNVTYWLVQVTWFATVIWFDSEVLPQCSCCVRLWSQFHLCFYSVKSQLVLPLACNSSAGSHAALCVMSGAGPCLPHPEGRRDWQEGSCERHEENKQACKWKWSRPAKLSSSFLFIIWFNWLSWQAYLWHKSTISSSLGFLCSDRNLVEA